MPSLPSMPPLTNLPLAVQLVLASGFALLVMSYGAAAVIRAAAQYRGAGHAPIASGSGAPTAAIIPSRHPPTPPSAQPGRLRRWLRRWRNLMTHR
jgi:hypothetical protein